MASNEKVELEIFMTFSLRFISVKLTFSYLALPRDVCNEVIDWVGKGMVLLAHDDATIPFRKNIASVFTPHCFIQNWVEFKFFRFKLNFVMLGYFRENCRE